MGQVLTYYRGINTVYSNVLIGKTVNDANEMLNTTNIIHFVNNKKYIIKEIRVCEGIMEKNFCSTRLNVLVDQNRIICELYDCG